MNRVKGIPRLALVFATVGCVASGSAAVTDSESNRARPDRDFGGDGFVLTRTTSSGPATSAFALAEDAKGRLLAVGGAGDAFVIARYLRRGKLDPAFGGGDGLARVSNWEQSALEQRAAATSVVLQRDGRIVVAGFWSIDRIGRACLALARLKPGGGLDPTFGDRGRVLDCRTANDAFDVTVQADGRILVAGVLNRTHRQIGVVAGYTSRGELDPAFGGRNPRSPRGSTRFYAPNDESSGALDLRVLRSGRILASGYYRFNFMLARLRANGAFDTSFGGRYPGRVITDVARRPDCGCALGWGMTRDRQGRIIVTGRVVHPNPRQYIALVRFHPSGRIDRTFGPAGIVRTKIGDYAVSQHVAVQRDGRIVVVGQSGSPSDSLRLAVVRYDPDGSLDRSFFARGRLIRRVGPRSGGRDVIIDRAGRVVISGGADRDGTRRFLLARYLPGRS